jgi:hypothetical protein
MSVNTNERGYQPSVLVGTVTLSQPAPTPRRQTPERAQRQTRTGPRAESVVQQAAHQRADRRFCAPGRRSPVATARRLRTRSTTSGVPERSPQNAAASPLDPLGSGDGRPWSPTWHHVGSTR